MSDPRYRRPGAGDARERATQTAHRIGDGPLSSLREDRHAVGRKIRRRLPSTDKQLDLANLLAKELTALGAQNVRVSEFGIVYGWCRAICRTTRKVPDVGFIAHMDTSPAVSGANVNAIIHKNYQGGDIVLPNDKTQIITVAKNPDLKNLIGDDIITADGTTLLGSDDKSGCAEIMTMIDTLRQNPQIKHGNIAIAFTPDEEVGRASRSLTSRASARSSLTRSTAEQLGEISDETWSARTATVTFQGRARIRERRRASWSTRCTRSAITSAAFRKTCCPRRLRGRVGFVHPYAGDARRRKLERQDTAPRF